MSAVRAGRVLKTRGRRSKKSVVRMMAIMTDGDKEIPKEFVETGRTGRRNAMPDILHSDANVTTADLPDRLQQLATSVHSADIRINQQQLDYVGTPRHGTQQVIQLDEEKLRPMNTDPDNPQAGPSAGAPPPDENNDKEKGS